MIKLIIGPFFFAEKSITAQIYLDLLTEYVSRQLEQYQPQVIFQQDSAPPHWGVALRQFLNDTFPESVATNASERHYIYVRSSTTD